MPSPSCALSFPHPGCKCGLVILVRGMKSSRCVWSGAVERREPLAGEWGEPFNLHCPAQQQLCSLRLPSQPAPLCRGAHWEPQSREPTVLQEGGTPCSESSQFGVIEVSHQPPPGRRELRWLLMDEMGRGPALDNFGGRCDGGPLPSNTSRIKPALVPWAACGLWLLAAVEAGDPGALLCPVSAPLLSAQSSKQAPQIGGSWWWGAAMLPARDPSAGKCCLVGSPRDVPRGLRAVPLTGGQ